MNNGEQLRLSGFYGEPAEGTIVPFVDPILVERGLSASFKFVLCRHVAANAGSIAEQLQECDVIALETGAKSRAVQDEMSVKLTKYASPVASVSDIAEVETLFYEEPSRDKEYARVLDNLKLFQVLLESFRNSGKQIRLIDRTHDHPYYTPGRTEFTETSKSEANEAYAKYGPIAAMRAVLLSSIERRTASHKDREKIMVNQLQSLGLEFPNSKIGVMCGAVHTPVQHEIGRVATTERVFVGLTPSRPNMKAEFKPREALERQLRFGKEVNATDMDRFLLSHILGRVVAAHSATPEILNVIRKMPDPDVEKALEQINTIFNETENNDSPEELQRRLNEVYGQAANTVNGSATRN